MEEKEDILHEGKRFTDVDYSGKKLADREFVRCIFERCDFSNSDLGDADFVDCEFRGCNFSMAKLQGAGLSNTWFAGCKLMGVDFSTCNKFLFSFTFEDCILDYSTFVRTKIKGTKFKNTSLKQVDFEGTDLTAVSFSHCDLADATFVNSILEKTDFSTARNFTIDPDVNRMKKAKFAYRDLAGLLGKYQLDIRYD
ncbi:pentapeptide repeat-containing protein [Hufsiella ginkgonis]|uniref:Pentapeptide repeat-containing protein n=1 Tax=Hufsiella ginkgonis TaxID=2695274 RepID=A0A7K1XYK5_9SPHI|nr:pentapeptide repeat-containing protein [Hufsiella ginkgonis]MXV16033.1 pentapeptide repeat-containing protein [Hufsiella ginkgonis]